MAAKRHRLARRRKAVGFTQEGLAEQLGVDSTTVRRWESGETAGGPQPWVRRKLAHHLQVSAEQLDELLNDHANYFESAQESPDSSNRRSLLGYGVAAAVTSALGTHDATQALYRSAAPQILFVPVHTSWAKATYDAVLNPMDAARRAIASWDTWDDGAPDLPALRVVIDRAMQVSLSSDYGALEESLPTLIGCVEAATVQPKGDERAAHV
ncbi:MAG: helix-turn-helix domain-containing protein, partial [Actinobacteria bacterium]|nr:helix-turn-helix domain-containing protein [Actinomycetota bacterium]